MSFTASAADSIGATAGNAPRHSNKAAASRRPLWRRHRPLRRLSWLSDRRPADDSVRHPAPDRRPAAGGSAGSQYPPPPPPPGCRVGAVVTSTTGLV